MAENSKGNVRKVYISDSPVQDDNIEYNYVSSDVEEDLNRSQKIVQRVKTPGLPKMQESEKDNKPVEQTSPAAVQELSEEDELAKEAQYQKELQDRLENTALDEDVASGHSDERAGETLPMTDQSNSGPDEDVLEWKNPPANPFILSNTQQESGQQHTDIDSDSARYDENPPVFTDEEDYKAMEQQRTPGRSHIDNQVENPRFYNVKHSNTGYAIHPNTTVSNSYSSNQQALSLSPADAAAAPSKPTQANATGVFDHSAGSADYHYNMAAQAQDQDIYGYNYPSPADYPHVDYHSNSKTFQQQAYELEQRQLMLQQQHQMQQHAPQMQSPLQRNAPVMYMQNPLNPNEYYVVTPQDASQQSHMLHASPDQQQQPTYQSPRMINGSVESPRAVKGVVAPKPTKPTKNYVEKNKHRAVGQHSAKPGYSDRLVIKRQEQEQMKDWAPGMIIPRKKAASADDAARPPDREIPDSAEDMWSKKSRELANAKQAKLSGAAKGKKPGHSKPSSLTRFPSDNSLAKRKSRPPIPPINQAKTLKSYSENYQPSPSQRFVPEPSDVLSNSYPSQGQTVNSANWVLQKGISPQQNGLVFRQGDKVFLPVDQGSQSVPLPQLYQAQSPNSFQSYQADPQPQMSPVLNQPFVAPASGPPSGGYHHNSRHREVNAGYILPHPPNNLLRNPYQQEQAMPIYSQPPPPPIRQPLVPLQQQQQPHQQQHHLLYTGENQVPPQMNHIVESHQYQHPAYDYSGYMGYPEQAEPERQPNTTNYESESKPYDSSSYSSPQPQNYSTTISKPVAHERDKVPLNPYAAIPPIYSSGVKPPQKNPGSYVDAYQKEKERVNGQLNPNYKVYTMKDYKNLKLEYKLGGLGPSQDPKLIKEKNEQRLKQLKYAKEVVDAEKKKPHVSPQRKSIDEEPAVQQISSRQLAVEYAKHIPKPKVQSKQYNSMPPAHYAEAPINTGKKIPGVQALSQSPEYSADNQANHWTRQPDVQPLSQIHLQDLEDLQRRHEEDRMAVAEIQYKMQQAA